MSEALTKFRDGPAGNWNIGVQVVQAAMEKLAADPSKFPYDDYRQTVNQLEGIQFYPPHYSEPGYDASDKRGVVLGNANDTWRKPENMAYGSEEHRVHQARCRKESLVHRVFKALERLGYEFEWEDEWITCDNCQGLVRTSGNCWGWKRHYYTPDGETVCGECVKTDESERDRYLSWLEGNHKRADMFDLDLVALGYEQVQANFEHGLHHGQDADPKRIADAIKAAGGNRFIFVMDSIGQFDFNFSVWLHQEEKHIIEKLKLTPDVVDGPSVSEALKRGLMEASLISASMPDIPGTIKYTKIIGDRAAGALIPGDEFVKHGVTLAEQRIDYAQKENPESDCS